MNKAFVIFEAELPWIYPLALELGRYGTTVAISLGAVFLPFRRHVSWPFGDPEGRITTETWSYPPGFNGKLAALFNRPIRARLRRTIRRSGDRSGEYPYVIMPYPRFLPYLEDVDPSRLIYLNYDDYALSRRGTGRAELPEEEALANQAHTILCSSHYQTTRFKQRFPSKAHSIFHLPHGVHESFLNPEPLRPPDANTMCAIGYLTSRYDWKLIHDVVTRMPEVKFYFVGEVVTHKNAGQGEDWLQWLDAVLRLPNAIHVRGLKHRETTQYYWKCAANWMPYKPDLSFVKASCPLKLTDGLASGRRVISSEVPECQLYPEWISVYKNCEEAVSLIRAALSPCDPAKAEKRTHLQIEYARLNTWAFRALRLIELLARHSERTPLSI